jgi:hypothetical protein
MKPFWRKPEIQLLVMDYVDQFRKENKLIWVGVGLLVITNGLLVIAYAAWVFFG